MCGEDKANPPLRVTKVERDTSFCTAFYNAAKQVEMFGADQSPYRIFRRDFRFFGAVLEQAQPKPLGNSKSRRNFFLRSFGCWFFWRLLATFGRQMRKFFGI